MTKLVKIFIGSPNGNHMLSKEYEQKAISAMNNILKGYTLYRTEGFFEGLKEESLVFETFIEDSEVEMPRILLQLEQLKKALQQNCILMFISEMANPVFI